MKPRTPPNSQEAEQSVLGALMLSPEKLDTVLERITESDFYRGSHRAIFRALVELTGRGQPCDAVTLGEWFESNGLADVVGGESYIWGLANNTPSSANVLAYVDIVREKSLRRQMIDRATNMIQAAYDAADAAPEQLDCVIEGLMGMQRTETRNEHTLRQAMTAAYKSVQSAIALGGKIPGIPTGLSDLDQRLGGWHDSDLVVIGARPAMGKTALLLNLALAAGVPCGIVSAEQPAEQLGSRVMSIESAVKASSLRNGRVTEEDLGKLSGAVARLVERTCVIYDRSSPTITDVTRIVRKWKQQAKIKILFVDYIQRIEGLDRKEKKHERVGDVVKGLKNLARDLNIPVVALCQVGRHVDAREDKRPNMGDMSDSSEIEKEADQILTLYRDEVYDEDTKDKGIAELSVEKNRHGPTGTIKCAWLGETMRFKDLYARYE